jgi:hemerythrin-like domain-containing protein
MTGSNGETATSRLREEHRLILRVADAMQALLADAGDGSWDFDTLGDCVTFIRLFADACHHGKEEDLLFPELERAGMSRTHGPIAVMLEEHRQGRMYAGYMADALDGARAGDEEARVRLSNAGRGYVDLIRGHIFKEDHVLFQLADQAVPGPACRALCGAYDGVCGRHFEGRTKRELEELAASIGERAGTA